MATADIEQITPTLTWQLRRDELYPGKYKHDMEMPEDDRGIHFGAFANHKLVGVVSLFQTGSDFQFRKFAVSSSIQKQGIGKQLLAYITRYAVNEGATRLWCNARIAAAGFYSKNGFLPVGDVFSKGGIDYVLMERMFDLK